MTPLFDDEAEPDDEVDAGWRFFRGLLWASLIMGAVALGIFAVSSHYLSQMPGRVYIPR